MPRLHRTLVSRAALLAPALAPLLTVSARPLGAQPAPTDRLEVGTRVRLRAPSVRRGRISGLLLDARDDTLLVARGNDRTLAIPVSAVTSAERSVGVSRSRGVGRGALYGGAAGLLLGAVLSVSKATECTANDLSCVGQPSDATIVIGTTAIGAVAGGTFGWVAGVERWAHVSVPLHTTLSVGVRSTLRR